VIVRPHRPIKDLGVGLHRRDLVRQELHVLRRLVDEQVATVKTYAQVLIGLCGLTITVTGFSGAHMIRSGSIPATISIGRRRA
jgi:hypothetical protein